MNSRDFFFFHSRTKTQWARVLFHSVYYIFFIKILFFSNQSTIQQSTVSFHTRIPTKKKKKKSFSLSYMFRICLPATGQRRVTIDRSHKKEKGKVGGLYLTYFPTLPTLPIVPTHFRHSIAPLPRKEKRTLPQINSFNPFSASYERKIKFLLFTLRC